MDLAAQRPLRGGTIGADGRRRGEGPAPGGSGEGTSQAKAKAPATHLIAFEGHTTGAGCGTPKALGWGAAMPPWGLCSRRRGTGASPGAAMFPFIFR